MSDYDSLQIYINSKYADQFLDSTNSNILINLPYITVPNGHYIHLSVVNATIPFSFYTVNDSNHTIQINSIPTTGISPAGTYYIPNGCYNANQLASTLTNLIPSMVVTYNNILNIFFFTCSTTDFIIDITYTTATELLGLSTNNLYNTSIGKVLRGYTLINLTRVRTVNIVCNYNTGNINILENNFYNTLCSIPVLSPPYSLITYTNPNNYSSNLYISEFNNITLKLVDQDGSPINLNGQYFNLTLQIDVLKFT
jgi:hypothetical protein